MYHLVLLSALTAGMGQYAARPSCPTGTCPYARTAPVARPAAPAAYYQTPTPAPYMAPAAYPVQAQAAYPAPATYSRGYSQVAAPQQGYYVPAPAPSQAPVYRAPAMMYRTSAATCPNGTCPRR